MRDAGQRAEFARNCETLCLAEPRIEIDEYLDDYILSNTEAYAYGFGIPQKGSNAIQVPCTKQR